MIADVIRVKGWVGIRLKQDEVLIKIGLFSLKMYFRFINPEDREYGMRLLASKNFDLCRD
jgi:hypothetical protein